MISIMQNLKLRELLLSFYELQHHSKVYEHLHKSLELLLRNRPYSLCIGKLEKENTPSVQHTINFPTTPKILRYLSEFIKNYMSKNDFVSSHTDPQNLPFFQHTNSQYDEIRLYRIRPSQQSNASRVFVTGEAYYSN